MEFPPVYPDEKEKCRIAFTDRPLRPTYAELSAEYRVPLSTIGKWSAQDNWLAMRTARIERQTVEGDAMSVLLEATSRVNRPVIAAVTNAVLCIVQGITQTAQDVDPEKQKSPSTRAEVYQTCSFALKNLADACKTIGIIGFPRELANLKGDAGGWTPELASQLNVTINNVVSKGEAKPVSEAIPTT